MFPPQLYHLCNVQSQAAPKPPSSPHYPDFKTGMNQDQLRNSEKDDLAWLLARHLHRNAVNTPSLQFEDSQESEGSEVSQDLPQPVPVWAAYNSLASPKVDDSYKLDKVHGLPIVNSPAHAHEWTTLTTALVQLHNLSQLMRTSLTTVNQHLCG